jgi:hypothetical protein
LHRLIKYFNKLANIFDISPIDTGGITKLLVYIIWGSNALLFLGKDINIAPEFFNAGSNSVLSIQCTVLKKVSNTDLFINNFTFVKVSNIVVILPYDYELPILDVITLPRDRSPPSQLFT